MANSPKRQTVIPLYVLTAAVFFLLGYWLWNWHQQVDYSINEFRIIEAERFEEKHLQGYITYLDFWASWCAPCRQSFPWMQQMHERYSKDGLRIVAINLDSERKDMMHFLDEHQTGFTIVADPSYTLFRKYAILGVPTSVILDAQGNEIQRHQGFRLQQQEQYEQHIQHALQQLYAN